jgi:hypothetical protein
VDPCLLATISGPALALMLFTAPAVPHPVEVARHAAQQSAAPQLQAQPSYSEAYYRRLAIHRGASYLMLPLFAAQYVAGQQLYDKADAAPLWAKTVHRMGATGLAGLFAVNVATGVPNLVAGLQDPRDRGRRTFHATMMLAAAAGFTATGLLSERAETSPDDRDLHRTMALTSVTLATVGYLSMLDWFRRE